MWVTPRDVHMSRILRFLLHTMLRIHGFSWYGHRRIQPCTMIHHVYIRGNQIIVYHDADSHLYKSIATWTRMRIPEDPETQSIRVHISDWPPEEYNRND